MTNDLAPIAPVYRYFVEDLISGKKLAELDFRGVSYKLALNAAGEFTGSLVIKDEYSSTNVYDATLPGLTALYILRNNECVWGGIIWDREYFPEDKKLGVSASEFTSYLHHRKIWKTWNHEFGGTVRYMSATDQTWSVSRTNIATRPYVNTGMLWTVNNSAYYTSYAATTSTTRRAGIPSYKIDRNATTANNVIASVTGIGSKVSENDRLSVAGGVPYYVGLYLNSNTAWAYKITLDWYNSAGTAVGQSTTGVLSQIGSLNQWQRVAINATAPFNATAVQITLDVTRAVGSTTGVESVLLADALIERTDTYTPNTYIDGATNSLIEETRYRWTGSAGDSVAVEEKTADIGFEVAFDNGSAVQVEPGSTVKLTFYDVADFQYNGYFRVRANPAPTSKRFFIAGGSAIADIVRIEYTGTQMIFYTKENHGFNTGDVVSYSLTMLGNTSYPGGTAVVDAAITAPGGSETNMFYISSVAGAGAYVAEGIVSRLLPRRTYTDVTIGVRQDTFDYVRSLIEGTFNDFVGTEFPNVYIEPGISHSMAVTSKQSANGYSIIKTAAPHNVSVGQAIQIQDVGPEFDGEFEVTGVESGQSIVYRNGGTLAETATPVLSTVVDSLQYADGIATVTTIAAHGMRVGSNVVLDLGPRYPEFTGSFLVLEIPSTTSLRFLATSSSNYPTTVLTDSTVTVGGTTRVVTNASIAENKATLTTKVPHGFNVGNSVVVANTTRDVNVIEKSLDGPNAIGSVQTAAPHGFTVGTTVELSGLTDVVNVNRISSTTTDTTMTTVRAHNIRPGNLITIYGTDELSIINKQLSANVATLTTSVPHNFSVGNAVTITGITDNYNVTGYKILSGTATVTMASPHNVLVNDEITLSNMPDYYSVVTKAVTDGVVTLTTQVAHNVQESQKIVISGLGLPYDGEVTVSEITDQRIVYKVDSKNIDAQVSAAARSGQNLTVPMTVAEQKANGTVQVANGYMTGDWKVSAVTATTVDVVRGGNDYSATNPLTGLLQDLSFFNGQYTITAVSGASFSFAKAGNIVYPTAVPLPAKNDDIPPVVVKSSVYAGTRTVTSVTVNSFTFALALANSATRDADLAGTKPSIFNGTRTVASVPAVDRFTFSMPGYTYSMIEQGQTAASIAQATNIYNGTYTITNVDAVNNRFSFTRAYNNLPDQAMQNRGVATVSPLLVISTFGPYPGNADIGFVFPETGYSGINVEPAVYRGFELKTVGEALDDYSNNINGFEYRIDCEYLPDEDRFLKKFVLLPIDFPNPPAEGQVSPLSRFGADKLVFEYPSGSVTTFSMRESAEDSVTRFFALGENNLGPDVGPNIGVAAAEELLTGQRDKRRWPLLDGSDSVDGIDDKAVLYSYANRFLSELQPPFATFAVTLNGSRPPYIDTYKPGDWCSVIVNDPWMKMRLRSDLEPRNDVIVRKINSISVSVPDGVRFPENVTLELVAEWEVDKRG